MSLAEKLGSKGLVSHSLHPGVVSTHLADHLVEFDSLSTSTTLNPGSAPLERRLLMTSQRMLTAVSETRRVGKILGGRRLIRVPLPTFSPPLSHR